MWAVSDAWLAALGGYRELVTEVTVTLPGAGPETLELISGRLTVDGALFRRRSIRAEVVADAATYRLLSTPGATVQVRHGHVSGGIPDLVPILVGELIKPTRNITAGSATVTFVDRAIRVERSRFLSPFQTSTLLTRAEQIAALVTGALPVTVQNLGGGTDLLTTVAVWEDDRADAIRTLLSDGAMEGFFGPDGTYVMRRPNTRATPPAWTIRPGDAGTLKAVSREVPLENLYNTVIVRPAATDGSQTWTQQIAQITDPAHPRHPSKIGVVPLVVESSTATSAAQALAVAEAKLARVLGTSETLQLEVIGNPALDAGDVVRVVTPQIGQEPADAVTHLVDSFTLDLKTDAMDLQTRSFDA